MSIKQLASQTFWYGLSNVGARLIGFLLTPILTYLLPDESGQVDYGNYSLLYAYIGIINIIYTYGLETGYFWLINKNGIDKKSLFNTTYSSHIITTVLFSLPIILFYKEINAFLDLGAFPTVILLTAIILIFDTLSTIPFAKLRQDNRPRMYAFIKIAGIIMNVFLVILFLYILPTSIQNTDIAIIKYILSTERLVLIIFANVAQSFFSFLLLFFVWKNYRFKINTQLLKRILTYSLPMILIGLGGMINELISRIMLDKLINQPRDNAKILVGIFSANYKIAIFITLFIQAFRMAAEPFFFKQSNSENAPIVYANVMKWFVITLTFSYLFTILFLDTIILMINDSYRISGFGVIPILLLANIFLGIYYNLSVWYKVSNKMMYGVFITTVGVIVTIILNYLFIPYFDIYAAATTTMICYLLMVVLAYSFGQKHYPIPYENARILFYLMIMFLIGMIMIFIRMFFLEKMQFLNRAIIGAIIGMVLFLSYLFIVIKKEKILLTNSITAIKKSILRRK